MSQQADTPCTDPFTLSHTEHQYCYSVALRYVKNPDAAADIAQDALLTAYRHRFSFRGDSQLTTWLYRVTATAALMFLRKRKRRAREVLVDHDAPYNPLVTVPDHRESPEERLGKQETLELARERVDELGDKYRDIFWLRYKDGYTETEIAEQLGLNVSTVKTRAHRARTAVRQTLRCALA